MSLASTALFGSISHYTTAIERREAQLASMEGRAVSGQATWATASRAGKAAIAAKEASALTGHVLWGAAVGEVSARLAGKGDQPPPETLREWALQGISVVIGRHVNERVIAHSQMYKALGEKAEDGGRALTQSAQKLAALAKEVVASKNPRRAVDLLVEQEHFLALEVQAIDHELQRPVAHADETYEASKNLDAAKAAASSDEMFATKATLLGMEELVPGALWKGTRRQINEAINHQTPRPKVLNEGPKWKLQLRDRVIEVSEVAESSPSKAGLHDASPGNAAKESRAAAAVPSSEFTGRSPAGRNRARVPVAAIHKAAESAITILNGPIGGDFAMTHDNRAITLNTGREWARIDIDIDDTGDAVATHTYTRGNARAHIIISEEARGDDLVRALAHELAEIRALMADSTRKPSDPDALATGSVAEKLSHHDVGRKAELQVLLYELQSQPERAAEIKAEIRALVSHLGFELEGIAKSARARKLLGNDVVNSLSAFTSLKRVPVDVDSVKITPGIRAAEWWVSIDATLPDAMSSISAMEAYYSTKAADPNQDLVFISISEHRSVTSPLASTSCGAGRKFR